MMWVGFSVDFFSSSFYPWILVQRASTNNVFSRCIDDRYSGHWAHVMCDVFLRTELRSTVFKNPEF